jgi:uncharacterized protein (TIGR03000 family)
MLSISMTASTIPEEVGMVRRCLVVLPWILAAAAVTFGTSEARSAGAGHGGGAGHALAGRGPYGRGYGYGYGRGYGYGYGRGYGYYGYPGYYGLGLGLGVGYGYGYGYGPGYGYPLGYGYPPYDVNFGPPPGVIGQGGAVIGQPPGPIPQGNPFAAGPARLTDSDLLLSIHVPPDAIVRVNGTPTSQNGPRREFMSSGLSPGRSYTFVVAAHWNGPNGVVDLERRLRVMGGERRNVDFTAAPSRED